MESKGLQEALTDAAHPESIKALGLMKTMMDSSMLSVVSAAADCATGWTALNALFAATSTAKAMQLKQQLNTLSKKGKEEAAMYFQRGKQLQAELDTAGVTVIDRDLLMSLLQGLPTDYTTISQIIMATDPLPDFATVLSRVLMVEASVSFNNTPAFYGGYQGSGGGNHSGGGNSNDSGNGQEGSRQPENRKCHYCLKRGHLKHECRKRKSDLAKGINNGGAYNINENNWGGGGRRTITF